MRREISIFALTYKSWDGRAYLCHSTYNLVGQGFSVEDAQQDLKRSISSYLDWYVQKLQLLPAPCLSESELLNTRIGKLDTAVFLQRVGRDERVWSDLRVSLQFEFYKLV